MERRSMMRGIQAAGLRIVVGAAVLVVGFLGARAALADDQEPAKPDAEAKKESPKAEEAASAPVLGLTRPQPADRGGPIGAAAREWEERSRQLDRAARLWARERVAGDRVVGDRVVGDYAYPAWGWYPWFGIPQTYPYAGSSGLYPPSITHTPRIGLQYNYPAAQQMGIRVPDDSDPLYVDPNLGPFVGVVERAKAEAVSQNSPPAKAIGLIKEKKYKEAGRILAEGYRDSDDPRYALLLSEVFFLMGKPSFAETLLLDGLRSEDALTSLPEDVLAGVAPPDDLEAKLAELYASEKNKLLAGYMALQSKEPERGIDILYGLAQGGDKEAARLYRHFLGRAFK
jgi:hypothetical protein